MDQGISNAGRTQSAEQVHYWLQSRMLLLLDFISEMLNVSCGQNTRLAFIHSMNNHQSLRDLVMHNQSRAQWLDRAFQEAMLLVLEFCEIS